MHLFLILLLPLAWPWISKIFWKHEITYKEIGINFGVTLAVTCLIYFLGMIGNITDHEVWNDQVTKKARLEVSCEHSYECNCIDVPSGTDSNGNTTYTRSCQTCYDHSFDVDWRVYSNIGQLNINRLDRQGLGEPPRWTQVQIGEPYSEVKSFQNYIKGAPDSLFNNKDTETKFANLIPAYPIKIYDYYKINRVLSVGVPVPDIGQWNKDISEILKVLGPRKKANIVIVFVKTNDSSYIHALEAKWLGGKKNDTVIVIGSTTYPAIDFVRVFSWSTNKTLNVELRDELMTLESIDREKMMPIINNQIGKNFNKRSMEEYSYLKDDMVPPTWLLVTCALVSILISGGIGIYSYYNDM